MRKIAIAISSDLEPPWPDLHSLVAGRDVVILTRGRAPAEQDLARQALEVGVPAYFYPARGNADNWQRDVDLVRDADEVVVVLSHRALESTNTGAWHVIERAINDGKPARLYAALGGRLMEIAVQ